MKILFTGGGSGGHFYPIIAIVEELHRIAREERLIEPELFFMAPEPYDAGLLFNNHLTFVPVVTGKLRRYASIKNVLDLFKTGWGILKACVNIFLIFPDVVVGKGGYGSFPALFAARLFRIPVLIHESDTVPGRVNTWAGKFAKRIAISYPETATHFPGRKVAYIGTPIRKKLLEEASSGAPSFTLSREVPVIAVLGGSLGSQILNDALFSILPELLQIAEVVHQTGQKNFEDIRARSTVLLEHHPRHSRYHPLPYLSPRDLREVGKRATLIISRAGSTIFEIAAWGVPSLLVPITDSQGDHQRENAYAYSGTGAALVIEEENLQPTILLSEIKKLLESEPRRRAMSERARQFAKTDAATVIAREIIDLSLSHETSGK